MADTLLAYLTSPNSSLDCTNSVIGTNTLNAKWDRITSLVEWSDFTYETVIRMYGPVLRKSIQPLSEASPPLSKLEKEIFTKKTFETVLDRVTMPEVSAAPRATWSFCYPNEDPRDIPEIARGDKARRGTTEEDDRYYADWAGIRQNQLTGFGYKSLCPGETKLSSKWGTSSEDQGRKDYLAPFKQVQTYCGRQWRTRYGYIITPLELVVVRVSMEKIGPGLASSRSMRDVPRRPTDQVLHSRNFSVETVSSGFEAMSPNTESSFNDDASLNIEFGSLLFKSIPWSAAGAERLTVKLALWWLHMETKKDVPVQQSYPALHNGDGLGKIALSTKTREKVAPSSSFPDERAAEDHDKSAGKKKRI